MPPCYNKTKFYRQIKENGGGRKRERRDKSYNMYFLEQ